MAKLSVYNTIDRSQLGGKFVPLIQSGVNNYKILASDLGKEYSPGDAIEITDTGVINVNYDPSTLRLSSFGLGVNTDYARGVFDGANGIYIASADSSIGVSSDGIKVNTPFLAGYGLRNQGGSLYVKSASSTISVDSDGISVYYGSGLKQDDYGRLTLHNEYLSHYATVRAGHGLYWYNPGYDDSALYVKSADSSILANEFGLKVHAYALIDQTYLDITYSHTITVDTGAVARAITGTGLVNTNGAIGANVNTATGLTINDNKLYLNAGNGLQTSNNTVSVKAADESVGISYSGVKVNTGYGLKLHSQGVMVHSGNAALMLAGRGLGYTTSNLCVKSADDTILVDYSGISVDTPRVLEAIGNTYLGSGLKYEYGTLSSALYAGSGARLEDNYISVYAGSGLGIDNGGALDVISSDSTISVNHSGIRVNPGYGLSATSEGLYVKSADSSIGVDYNGIGVRLRSGGGILRGDDGLYFDSGILSIPTAHTLAGDGLYVHSGSALSVKPGDGILVGDAVNIDYDYLISRLTNFGNSSNIKSESGNYIYTAIGNGLGWGSGGAIYVKSADNSIGVSNSGIKVNVKSGGYILSGDQGLYLDSGALALPSASDLAGAGLDVDAGKLYVKSANGTIGVSDSGIGVNVTSGGGLLTGNDGLYVDSGKLAGRGLTAHTEQNNVKLNVNVGQYDLSSNNRSSNLLKIDTATNALYVRGVDVTGIIGTNNTMTRQQDPNSYYHSFGVDVDYLFSTYTDQSTLVYRGNKLSVHLSRIAGDGLGYDSTRKAIYVTSGGSMRGVAVSTPNNTDAYADMGGVAIGESAVTGGANSIAIGRFIHLDSGSTESIAIGYTASAIGYGSVSLGARASSSANLSVAIGYNAKSSGGIAIGYEASASDGMMSLTVYHSSGTCFNYSYDKDGNLCYYHNSGNSYTRSWKNLLTPPNYSTAVSINTNTEYTADRPAYIAFNVYAGGTSGYVVEFIKNSVTVFNVGVLYGLTIYNIIPVSKGDKYKLNITDYGATNPAVYAYRIYPS